MQGIKRVLVGRPVRSDGHAETPMRKRFALPVLSSNALSSVAYSPDEILLTLSVAGLAAQGISPWVGLAVVVVLAIVVASYRQTVRAYPSGGGDYTVTRDNLGPRAGVTAAGALLVDHVLTLAVSVAAAVHYLTAAVPALRDVQVPLALALVAALTMVNLRGLGDARAAFAGVVYLFMATVTIVVLVGVVQHLAGTLGQAPSAGLTVAPVAGYEQGLVGAAGALVVLRAFSSGGAALTGVETISTRVPSFRRPRGRNAAAALLGLGALGAAMLMAVLLVAIATGVRYVADPAAQLFREGTPVGEAYRQDPVLAQITAAVFDGAAVATVVVALVTAGVLLLAAHTAFTGFPYLASVLGRDGYLPRQLHTRGDRLVHSNGILVLAVAAAALVVVFGASVTELVQVYIVGVFVAFTLSQLGMLRHWTRRLRESTDRVARVRMRRAATLNSVGLVLTGTVLVVVLVTRFTHGAWVAVLMIALLQVAMTGIHRHYARVADELRLDDMSAVRALPARVHAVVLVARVQQPALRAVAYARATRPATLEALTVAVDHDEAEAVRLQWAATELPVPLTVLDAPYRELTGPVVDYVRDARRRSPRDVVVVFIPRYMVRRWWERVLHNQSARRLEARLLRTPGVVIASVPWQPRQTEGTDG